MLQWSGIHSTVTHSTAKRPSSYSDGLVYSKRETNTIIMVLKDTITPGYEGWNCQRQTTTRYAALFRRRHAQVCWSILRHFRRHRLFRLHHLFRRRRDTLLQGSRTAGGTPLPHAISIPLFRDCRQQSVHGTSLVPLHGTKDHLHRQDLLYSPAPASLYSSSTSPSLTSTVQILIFFVRRQRYEVGVVTVVLPQPMP